MEYKIIFWANFIVIPLSFFGMCFADDYHWWYMAHFIISMISQPVLLYAMAQEKERRGRKK